jgi:hypothetical protein
METWSARPYSVVPDDEMLMALFPDYLPKAIAGMEAPAKTDCATRFRNTASSRLRRDGGQLPRPRRLRRGR